MRKERRTLAPMLILAIIAVQTVQPEAPYRGYIYNTWGEAVPTPVGYVAERVVRGVDVGAGDFARPADLFVADNGDIYILDSGNNRVVVTDAEFRLKKTIDALSLDGVEDRLDDPSGIFVSGDEYLLIADTGNRRVVRIDPDGNIERIYVRPETELYPDQVEFLPRDVVADYAGNVYVLVEGIYQGSILYDAAGRFLGYYGSEEVSATAQLLSDLFWKRIFSAEQRAKMLRYVPTEIGAFFIDAEGFIYTCTKDAVKKLNPMGNDILARRRRAGPGTTVGFGDLESLWLRAVHIDTRFVDVCVDDEEFINVLDATRGRVFQYDDESNLLFVVGGMGSQMGLFRSAAAIETSRERILVLDDRNSYITVLELTEFGRLVHDAVKLYNEGFYQEAEEPWREVLERSANFELAYVGIGKSLLKLEEYREAMQYFRLGYDRKGYSKAFKEYRTEVIRRYFPFIIAGVIVLVIGLAVAGRRRRIARFAAGARMGSGAGVPDVDSIRYPAYVAFHPVTGYEELKFGGGGSLPLSVGILVAWFAVAVLERQLTGFNFNLNNPRDINVFFILGRTVGLFVLFVVSNLAVAEFVHGEGKFWKVWVACAYAAVPHIAITAVVIILSHFMIIEEGIFLTWLTWVGAAWSIALVLAALREVHDYSAKQVVLSFVVTLVGMAVVVFLGVLLVSLFQQLYGFFRSIASELLFRM
jgi:tetratricopeptide (TPR) repeat protein